MQLSSSNKVNLASFDNDGFNVNASFMKRLLWFVLGRIFVHTYLPFPQNIKKLVLKIFGAQIANGVVLKPKVNIKYPWLLTIGEHSWIGEKVWIDNLVPVSIGANCCISQGAMLLTGNHNYKKPTFDLMTGEIILEEGVWVGAKAVVCPGVILRSHSILAVGSVLSQSTEACWIYRGNPATQIKERIIQ